VNRRTTPLTHTRPVVEAGGRPEALFDRMPVRRAGGGKRLSRRGEVAADLLPAGDSFPPNLSVIVLALNEEVNLSTALSSVSGSRDVVVLDSGSTDGTVEIAGRQGARVFEHRFTTSAAQRQWALEKVNFANPLVFVLDADEWVTVSLSRELATLCGQDPSSFAAAWARSRYVYESRWIPRSSLYPSWTMRLLRLGEVRYEDRMVNEHPTAHGIELRLENDLIHEDHKPLAERMRKLDRYARLEAIETSLLSGSLIDQLREATTWRRRVKLVHSVLPCRATTKAVALLLRGGFLEGKAGLHFIEESAWQERMTYRYLVELRRQFAQYEGDQSSPTTSQTADAT
jgi:hypothetical protein